MTKEKWECPTCGDTEVEEYGYGILCVRRVHHFIEKDAGDLQPVYGCEPVYLGAPDEEWYECLECGYRLSDADIDRLVMSEKEYEKQQKQKEYEDGYKD